MKRSVLVLLGLMVVLFATAQKNVYAFTVSNADGEQVSLKQYKGKVLLIVNTATRCGFTPQYEELEALYEKFRGAGFEVLDFPCNQFGEQAPGSIREIHSFCTANYDIHFPQFDKVDVNGDQASPLFTYLKKKQGFAGFDTNDKMGALLDGMLEKEDADFRKKSDIKWNFTKFLVDRRGNVVARFEPSASMADVEQAVHRLLK